MKAATLLAGFFPALALCQTGGYALREDPLGYVQPWRWSISITDNGQLELPSANRAGSFPVTQRVFDIMNTNTGLNGVFQVAELTGFNTETAYPNASYNNPPGGSVAVTKGLSNYHLGVHDQFLGEPLYQVNSSAQTLNPAFITFGVGGIALSPDTNTLYYSVIGGRSLYSGPTNLLRFNTTSNGAIAAAIQNLGEKGISDGLDTDTNGIVYAGNVEQSGVSMFNPPSQMTILFTRGKRINWVDTFSIGADGYLYFTVNQLNDLMAIYPGQGAPLPDRRVKPYVAFRKKLPNGGTKSPGP